MNRKPITFALAMALSTGAAGCGVVEQGRSPALVRIVEISGSSGAQPGGEFGGYLHSDVITIVTRNNQQFPTRFSDPGRVTFQLIAKNTPTGPTALNSVTFTRYRVVYRRTDGHNIQGVDVPYAFDSGMTQSVSGDQGGQQTFDLVRVTAKEQPPLLALAVNGQAIDTIADVTFYGKDMANNDVSATGSIGITFANYGDPN